MSRDHTTALQPGQQSKTVKKRKKENQYSLDAKPMYVEDRLFLYVGSSGPTAGLSVLKL